MPYDTQQVAAVEVDRFTGALDRIRNLPDTASPGQQTVTRYHGRKLAGGVTARLEAEKKLRMLRGLFAFARVDSNGSEILDVGCGFGFNLLALRSLGAAPSGIELKQYEVDYARRMVGKLGWDIDIHCGSASDLPYRDRTFDVLLCVNVISHISDYRSFLAEAHRVLRSGGTLLITDGNNGWSPRLQWRNLNLWRRSEANPWDGPPRDPDDPWQFVSLRYKMIREALPELTQGQAREAALRTRYLAGDDVIESAFGELPSGRFRWTHPTVHPVWGQLMERPFRPHALARVIRSYGFETRVRGYWGGASGRHAIRAADRLLGSVSRVSIFTARGFRIAARRA